MGSMKFLIFAALICLLVEAQFAAAADKVGGQSSLKPIAGRGEKTAIQPTRDARDNRDKAADRDTDQDGDKTKAYDGWRLKQVCEYQGDEVVTWCSYGVKIESPRNGLTAIFTAPFKIVTYYDLRTGLRAEIPIEKNDNPYQKTVAITNGVLLNDVPVHKKGESNLFGWPVTKYESSPDYMAKQLKAFQAQAISDHEASFATYEVFSTVKGEHAAFKFIAEFYGIPCKDGLPAFFKYTKISGRTIPHLETKSCKQAKILPNEFSVPPNLKHATSSQAVLSGEDAYMMGL